MHRLAGGRNPWVWARGCFPEVGERGGAHDGTYFQRPGRPVQHGGDEEVRPQRGICLWRVRKHRHSLVFAALLLTAEKLGDSIGRRWLFIAGVLIFVLNRLLAAASQGPTPLISASVIQGIGGAYVLVSGVFGPLTSSATLWGMPPWTKTILGAWGSTAFSTLCLVAGAWSRRRSSSWRIQTGKAGVS